MTYGWASKRGFEAKVRKRRREFMNALTEHIIARDEMKDVTPPPELFDCRTINPILKSHIEEQTTMRKDHLEEPFHHGRVLKCPTFPASTTNPNIK
jgi:hypothetical protein